MGKLQRADDLHRAQKSVLYTGSEVRAEATASGGGTISVWSDGGTLFDGMISAEGRGGGFIKPSGKTNPGTGNHAVMRVGQGGQWLLDAAGMHHDSAQFRFGCADHDHATGTSAERKHYPDRCHSMRWRGKPDTACGWVDRGRQTVEARGTGAVTLTAEAGIDAREGILIRGSGDITLAVGTSLHPRGVRALGSGSFLLNAANGAVINGTIEARWWRSGRTDKNGGLAQRLQRSPTP